MAAGAAATLPRLPTDWAPPNASAPLLVLKIFSDQNGCGRLLAREGLHSHHALSLKTGWNFLRAADRKAAKGLVRQLKPYTLIVAFPYTVWSSLQGLTADKEKLETRR